MLCAILISERGWCYLSVVYSFAELRDSLSQTSHAYAQSAMPTYIKRTTESASFTILG